MRSLGKAIFGVMASVLLGPAALAQEAPSASLPTAPVPYVQVRPPAASPPAAARKTAPAGAPAAAAAAPPAIAPIDPARLEAYLDGWMAEAMARGHVPGATLAVVQNGQVILKKGYGFADLEAGKRVDPDRSLFRIGSISKTFTWILLMREVEAKRIRLDAPINLYLPEKVRLSGKYRDLLVRNLMDHSGGFEDRALGQLFENDPRRVRPLALYLRQERPGRVRAPGLLSSYSNYGAALAGEAVAFVGGKTFERRVEDEIALPLGMTHTTFRERRSERRGLPAAMPERLSGDVAKAYGWRNAGFAANDYEYIGQVAPAGSGSSTAGDMSRYMLMLLGDGALDGVNVFGPQAAKAFRTPMRLTPKGINGWAHGFMTFDLPAGKRGYGHLGNTIGFQSNMTLVPELGLGVFVSTNGEGGVDLANSLPGVVVRRFYGAADAAPRRGSADLAAAADMFEGRYLSTRRAYGGLEGFVGLLNGGVDVSVTSGGRLLTKRGGDVRAWVPEGPVAEGRFIAVQGDERMAFQVRNGKAVSFLGANNSGTMQRTALAESTTLLAVLAGLTGFSALATLAGLVLRNRRELRQNQVQARASLVQAIQAGLWLTALILFAIWASGASDTQAIMYRWPGLPVVTASACALVAAALTLLTIAALPAVWQGGRRVDSWTGLRKVFFTASVLIYTAFSVLLAINGALEPWSR